jgi:hypothetical protein
MKILLSLMCVAALSACKDDGSAALAAENAALKQEIDKLKSRDGAVIPATRENLCRLVRISTRASSPGQALPVEEEDLQWLRSAVNDKLRARLDETNGQEAVDIWIRDEVNAAFGR